MIDKPHNTHRLIELVTELQLHGPTPEAVAELQDLLAGSKSLCRLYVDLVNLNGLLGEAYAPGPVKSAGGEESDGDAASLMAALLELDAATGDVSPVELVTPPKASPSINLEAPQNNADSKYQGPAVVVIPKAAVWLGLAAAVLLVAWVLWPSPASVAPQNQAATAVPETNPAAPAGRVLSSVDAQWDGPFDPAAPIRTNQTVSLVQGLAEFEFNDGARVIVQAPAIFEPTGTNGLRLVRGKLTANVPLSAHGFTVDTPNALITDLGTEFGVEVDAAKQARVYVFEGEVTLASPASASEPRALVSLLGGQGRRVLADGEILPMQADAVVHDFVRGMDLASRYQAMILADRPLIYYAFDDLNDGVARNLASNRHHAEVHGQARAVFVNGRSAVSLDSMSAYLQSSEPIDELRGAESYTMECWVRPKRRDYGVICSLNLLGDIRPNRIYTLARLEVTAPQGGIGPDNRFRFMHINLVDFESDKVESSEQTNIYSDQVVLMQWAHVVAVKSGDIMTLYINGEVVGQETSTTALLDHDIHLVLGKFFTEEAERMVRARQFIGQLDELAIYDHAVSPEAIQARYEAGKDWLAD